MAGEIQVKWDPKNFEVRSRAVEQQLQPLIIGVTTLMNSQEPVKKRRGKSKKGAALVAAMENAVAKFIEKGEQIAIENPDVTQDMLSIVEEIRTTGTMMSTVSQEFVKNPCSSEKRSEMVKAARSLLAAVSRLLILADMVDVQLLLQSINSVIASLEKLRTGSNYDQLMQELKNYTQKSQQLFQESGKRQQNLIDPQSRDNLAAARAVLKKSSTMLLSASKSFLSHPNLPAAINNRDQALRQICEAVNTINDIAQGKNPEHEPGQYGGAGRVATTLETLETTTSVDYTQVHTQTLLEQQMEELISGISHISESASINDERRNKIMSGATALREALKNLLTQSMTPPSAEDLNDITIRTKQLKRQLGKAVANEITDNFFDTQSPVLALVTAAENGDVEEVERCAAIFEEHCNKLIEVANHVCELSNNEEGVKMVRFVASQLPDLCTGLINAARILVVDPQNITDQENMAAYKQAHENQVSLLLQAVDDISTIDDILSVLDQHIYDEMSQYVAAVQERDPHKLNSVFEGIRSRIERVCDLVNTEMDCYEFCTYTRNVLTAVKMLNDDFEKFCAKTEKIITTMEENPDELDENEFIDATRLIYDGVRDVRRAVLMNRADEDLDPEEVELEDSTYATDTLIEKVTKNLITSTITTTTEEVEDVNSGITMARDAMNKLPEKEKTKILEQVQNFESEKHSFDKEVSKWDDANNDIVVLAKYMCMIMIQMTDFVRQRGPLKTTSDVINAAKTISDAGVRLNGLTQRIADECPEGSVKKDLQAYIERVALYSHQISIIAKVKADVENNSNEELIIAGVESATSLIENAKNLMNAVVLTVKSSYIASSKFTKGLVSAPVVVWKMKAPEKKPLIRSEKRKTVRTVVRKGSQRKPQNPITVLAEFETV